MPFETIGFWLIYNILKKYTGGFHFNSSAVCYISTCIMCVLVLYLIRICRFDTLLYSVMTVVSGGITFALSPVPAIQKPLDEKEEQVFGKVARILVIVTVILYFICILCHLNYVAKIFAFGIISVALFAIAGKIKYVLCARKSWEDCDVWMHGWNVFGFQLHSNRISFKGMLCKQHPFFCR